MEPRLSSVGTMMKNLSVNMESDRMFKEVEEDCAPCQRESRRPSCVRVASPILNSGNPAGTRISVKDQIYALDCKVQAHENTIQKLNSLHQSEKALLLAKIEEITEHVSEELQKLQTDYQKRLSSANDEIERLNKCLSVQRGHISTLQEQCQSLHKHVVQVDDDLTKLATEVLGE